MIWHGSDNQRHDPVAKRQTGNAFVCPECGCKETACLTHRGPGWTFGIRKVDPNITTAVTGQIDVVTWGERDDTHYRLDWLEEEMRA